MGLILFLYVVSAPDRATEKSVIHASGEVRMVEEQMVEGLS